MSGILASTVGGGISDLVINITNTVNPNIPALVTAAGWLGTMQKIRIVSTGQVNTLDIPAGTLNGADILLDFTAASFVGGVYNGGTALKTRVNIKVRNLGTLAGGGGAGGSGWLAWLQRMANGHPQSLECYGGAGGRGQGFASGSLIVLSAQVGAAGEYKKLDPTGSFGGGGRGLAELWAGDGGAGGGWGSGGGSSNFSSASGDFDSWSSSVLNPGGAAGKAVDGNSYITWISTGTRLGGIA